MATVLNTIPAEESDTLLTKKPAASLKFQAHMGAANASTKAKKIVGAVAAAALVLGVLAATTATAGLAPTRTNLSSKSKAQQIKLYSDPSKCLTAKDGIILNFAELVLETCGGGGGHGTKLAAQQFTYTEKHGRGKIMQGPYCVRMNYDNALILGGCAEDDPEQNMLWEKSPSMKGYKHISMPWEGSHLCIDAESTKEGSPVNLIKCASQKLKQQQWEITSDVRPTSIQVKLADSSKCLAVHNPSTAKKGSPVEVYDCASKADAEKQGQAFYYDVSHGGCFIRWVYGNKNLCVNGLGGKNFEAGDAFGLFDCTYTKQEELQFMYDWLPTTIEMTATSAQLQMVPSHCAGKSGKCNPPNGDKVVGDDSWSQIEWTRV